MEKMIPVVVTTPVVTEYPVCMDVFVWVGLRHMDKIFLVGLGTDWFGRCTKLMTCLTARLDIYLGIRFGLYCIRKHDCERSHSFARRKVNEATHLFISSYSNAPA